MEDILYKGYTIINQDHPALLPFAIYDLRDKDEVFVDVASTKQEAKKKIDNLVFSLDIFCSIYNQK